MLGTCSTVFIVFCYAGPTPAAETQLEPAAPASVHTEATLELEPQANKQLPLTTKETKSRLDAEKFKQRLEKGQRLKEKLRERRRQKNPNAPSLLRGTSDTSRQRRENRNAANKMKAIEQFMTQNLQREKWLGQYKPLNMGCPLLGRRISVDAVSEWASKAWDCDGLGYAWKCVQESRE